MESIRVCKAMDMRFLACMTTEAWVADRTMHIYETLQVQWVFGMESSVTYISTYFFTFRNVSAGDDMMGRELVVVLLE